MNLKKAALRVLTLSTFSSLALVNPAYSAGFSTDLQSTSGLANSYAGSVTGVHDISDSFVNPAVISSIRTTNIDVSASYLRLNIKSSNQSGTHGDTTTPINGGGAKDAGKNAVVPAFYFATPINDKLKAGLNFTVPYGLATKYDADWGGRYQAVESELTAYNINPFAAYQLTDQLSLGAGFQAQYLTAHMSSVADVGAMGGSPGAADYMYNFKGNGWGYGYTLGAKYKLNDQLQFGFGYRSRITHTLNGTASLTQEGAASVPGAADSSSASTKIVTPETFVAGVAYQATPEVQLAFDSTWMRYSSVKSLTVQATSSNANLSGTSDFNWRDSWKNALGVNYKLNSQWILRGGLAYEKDAVNNNNRSPRVPTGNRTWLSAGTSFDLNKNLRIDFAYLHQFHKTTQSEITDRTAVNSSTTFNASYKTNVDVVSLGLRYEM